MLMVKIKCTIKESRKKIYEKWNKNYLKKYCPICNLHTHLILTLFRSWTFYKNYNENLTKVLDTREFVHMIEKWEESALKISKWSNLIASFEQKSDDDIKISNSSFW